MTNHANAPRVTAADLRAAATRLLGTVILDVAGVVSGPAVYQPRLSAFVSIDGDTDLGEDDGTLLVLVPPGHAQTLIAEHGTAGRAAAAVNAALRQEWSA